MSHPQLGMRPSSAVAVSIVACLLFTACSSDSPSSALDDGVDSTTGTGSVRDTGDEGSDERSDSGTGADTADSETVDTDTGLLWENPGCAGAPNVVRSGFRVDIEVDLTGYEEKSFRVRELVTVVPQAAGSTISLFGERLDIERASAGVAYDKHMATFCVDAFEAGDAVTVEVEYSFGEPALSIPGTLAQWGLRRFKGKDTEVIGPFNEPYFAPLWLFVPQSLHSNDAVHDDSPVVESYTLTVIAPGDDWTVLGPGGQAQREQNSYRFEFEWPTPIYAISFAAGLGLEVFDIGTSKSGVQVVAGVGKNSVTRAKHDFAAALTTIDWMEENVGPWEFGDTLTLVEIPNFGGGMEHTTITWIGSPTISGDFSGQFITVHETVHHWWGDSVRFTDWPHFWLAEGFDEYSTNFGVLGELMTPEEHAAHLRDYRVEGAELTYPRLPFLPAPGPLRFDDDDDMLMHFASDLQMYYTYGATFLDMVDARLERFYEGSAGELMADWYAEKRLESATTEEFLAFVEDWTGDVEGVWSALFDDWVYKTPVPTLRASDYAWSEGVGVSFKLSRPRGGDQSLEELEVAFVIGDEVTVVSAPMASEQGETTVSADLDFPPDRIVVDPDGIYILLVNRQKDWAGPTVDLFFQD